MSGKNKSAYPFYIILGSLICLVALSLVKNSFSIENYTSRPLDMLADLRTTPRVSDDAISVAVADSTATDTAALAGVPDPDHLHDFTSYTGILNYSVRDTAASGLEHFLQALSALKTGQRKKVRIAYFGDSMIEGDLITEDLRDSLQQIFGGAGVGFVPITSVVAGFRTTINHTFSKDWKDYSYKEMPPADVPLGISGHTFIPGDASWARYVPVRKRGLDKFEEVSLLYGPAMGANITVNDKAYALDGGDPVNKLSWKQDSAQNGVTIRWGSGNRAPLYGVCFEANDGIYVDNFSFRGISGVELGKLSKQLVEEMQSEHPYDLVVLHYGANILWKPELTDYSWYQRPMKKVMDSLRSDLPNTSFLVITTADKSYKKGGNWITAPGVTALLKTQHELAKEHGTAYWNLYAAMGGDGSMTRWVEGDTTLANKDYTHFNRQGAARVGALLYKAMMDEYKQLEHQ
jgi:lysophospholipase L1-like esterase